jgi:hypothetical protein
MLCASSCGHRKSVRRALQACTIYEALEAFRVLTTLENMLVFGQHGMSLSLEFPMPFK